MTKYLNLYRKFISISIQDHLVYRPVWALFAFMAHSTYIIISYIFLDVVVSMGNLDYTKTELLAFLSFFHAVKGLFWIICSHNINFIAGRGFKHSDLDFMLTKPVNHLWLVSTYKPNPFAITDLFGGLGMLIYYFSQLNLFNYPSTYMFIIFTIPLSSLLLYTIWFSYLLLVAPTGEANFTNHVLNLSWVYGQYPNSIYSGFAKIIATIIFPTILITSIPVLSIIQQLSFVTWLILPLSTFIGIIILQLIWHRALRLYNSAN